MGVLEAAIKQWILSHPGIQKQGKRRDRNIDLLQVQVLKCVELVTFNCFVLRIE